MGHADRHVLRDRTAAARAGDLGIVGNRVAVGGAVPRPFGFHYERQLQSRLAVLVTLIGIPAARGSRAARGKKIRSLW